MLISNGLKNSVIYAEISFFMNKQSTAVNTIDVCRKLLPINTDLHNF